MKIIFSCAQETITLKSNSLHALRGVAVMVLSRMYVFFLFVLMLIVFCSTIDLGFAQEKQGSGSQQVAKQSQAAITKSAHNLPKPTTKKFGDWYYRCVAISTPQKSTPAKTQQRPM